MLHWCIWLENIFRRRYRRCSVKKAILEILENSQENTCARVSFLIKLQANIIRPASLLKKSIWHRCFSVNFPKFLRTPFLREQLWWRLLYHLELNNSNRTLLLYWTYVVLTAGSYHHVTCTFSEWIQTL